MSKIIPPSEIAKEITSLSNDLSGAIGGLSKSLESSLGALHGNSLAQLLFGVLVAIVGAFSAYLFNFFHWKMVEKKRTISQITGELIALIQGLESVAVKYWVQDYRYNDKEEINATEVVIKSKLRLINHYIMDFGSILNIDKKKIFHRHLEDFHADIFDLVTGGDFESTVRKSSKPRAMKISFRCSDIRAKIYSLETRI